MCFTGHSEITCYLLYRSNFTKNRSHPYGIDRDTGFLDQTKISINCWYHCIVIIQLQSSLRSQFFIDRDLFACLFYYIILM